MNPFEVLGIPEGTSAAEIKKKYRQLAKKYHPDTNKDDKAAAEKFKEINNAYNLLKENGFKWSGRTESKRTEAPKSNNKSSSRSKNNTSNGNSRYSEGYQQNTYSGYSEYGYRPDYQYTGRGGSYYSAYHEAKENYWYEDVDFEMPSPEPGEDVTKEVTIDLKTAQNGATFNVHYEKYEKCPRCGGKAYVGDKPIWERCPYCTGRGCAKCNFTGFFLRNECSCENGRVKVKKEKKVKVDGHIRSSRTYTYTGEGNCGSFNSSKNGDLKIRFIVNPVMGLFHCKNDDPLNIDLTFEATLPIYMAFAGGKFTVPTLDEPVEIKVKPGTEYGTVYRVVGKGRKVRERVPDPKSFDFSEKEKIISGDLYVKVKWEMPKDLGIGKAVVLESVLGDEKHYPKHVDFKKECGLKENATRKNYTK